MSDHNVCNCVRRGLFPWPCLGKVQCVARLAIPDLEDDGLIE